MRPQTLDEIAGQEHLVGAKGVLRRIIESGSLPSIIFWGTPGIGKTTLANVIAQTLKRPFISLSAVSAGVKDVREAIEAAHKQNGAILFIDEIHRFNKSQQDALLNAVEQGIITLIGATTENPSFEVNSALLSRSQVYRLQPLTREDLLKLAEKALSEDEILRNENIILQETSALFEFADGDARKLLNLLELAAANAENVNGAKHITDELVTGVAQQKAVLYDKNGEQHYDIISAFIKSMRGTDPNAAVYWLARMLEGGEDPKFIARRMTILASEDIGNANPNALVLAAACLQSVQQIGMPEARILLSQTAVYLANSPKSNASYRAIEDALKIVRDTGNLPVPMHLRNAPTALMKREGYGKNYLYAHDFEGNFVEQEFLPDKLRGRKIYEPGANQSEDKMRERLKKNWQKKYDY